MSEYLMHVAICDDCASLALHAPAVCEPFKAAIRGQPDAMRLGATIRKLSTGPILDEARRLWPGGRAAEKVACVLGRLTHLSADAVFKAVFKTFGEEVGSGSRASMYEDLFAYREVYDQGRRAPFAPGALDAGCTSLPAARAIRIDELESVFLGACRLHVLRLQTALKGGAWAEEARKAWQGGRVDMAAYYDHYARRRPELEKKYLADINFYNPDDPLIRLARSIQARKPDAGVDLEGAVERARSESLWARAVAGGYRNICGASRSFAPRAGAGGRGGR
jgi:hypothetical protein